MRIGKSKIETSIYLTLLGGAFGLGTFFGTYKYDKEKVELTIQNEKLMKDNNELEKSLGQAIKNRVPVKKGIKQLIVYNNSSDERQFMLKNKVDGKGEGRIIKSKKHHVFDLNGTVYGHSSHNVKRRKDKFYDTIDTLSIGELIIRNPRQEVIVMN